MNSLLDDMPNFREQIANALMQPSTADIRNTPAQRGDILPLAIYGDGSVRPTMSHAMNRLIEIMTLQRRPDPSQGDALLVGGAMAMGGAPFATRGALNPAKASNSLMPGELPGLGMVDNLGRLNVPKRMPAETPNPQAYHPLDAQAYRSKVDQAEAAWRSGARDNVDVPFRVDEDGLPRPIISKAWDAAEAGQLNTATVNLSDLIAVQPGVDASRVGKILRNEPNPTWERLGGDDRPLVVQHNGKTYLVDGHHRLSAAYADGRKTADVDMFLAANPSTASINALIAAALQNQE